MRTGGPRHGGAGCLSGAAGAAGATILALVTAGCAALGAPAAPGSAVRVVAAESSWGSIAAQIGGAHASVTSIITNPNADPHSYEPTPADARALAAGDLVIENGIGYDPWVPQLLAADAGRAQVLDVGAVVGVARGGNPHRWYDPADVQEVVAAYVGDLARLDPRDRGYFQSRADRFETVSLAPYHALMAQIRARYSGTPVGASESIFSVLAPSLGLDLITPYSFLRAVSEGTEVTAADKSTIDGQIRRHLIKIYVYNRQNTTPDVQSQLEECRVAGIPTASITETLAPPSSTYQAWQTSQLQGIANALARATRR